MKSLILNVLLCVTGVTLFAVSVNMFAVPNEILQGGVSGIAMIVNRFFSKVGIGVAVLLLNIPLFILAWVFLNKRFVIKTVSVTVFYSVMLDIVPAFVIPYTKDRLLACVFCGVLSGLGLGLIFLSGATTGGIDIIAMIVRKYFPNISIGRVILFIDIAVVSLSFFVYGEIESVMYALIVVFLASKFIDTVLSGRDYRKLVLVITEKADCVSREIAVQTGRGITFIDAVGAYTGQGKKLLMCACSVSQSRIIVKQVKKSDSKAFTVIMNVSEIVGEGF